MEKTQFEVIEALLDESVVRIKRHANAAINPLTIYMTPVHDMLYALKRALITNIHTELLLRNKHTNEDVLDMWKYISITYEVRYENGELTVSVIAQILPGWANLNKVIILLRESMSTKTGSFYVSTQTIKEETEYTLEQLFPES